MTTHQQTVHRYYQQARKPFAPGYPPQSASRCLYEAKIVAAWDEAETAGLVRLRAEAEEESYYDSFGEPEAYQDGNGRWHSAEKAKEEMDAELERNGCWIVLTEYWDGDDWQVADSVGMCTGYEDPCDWTQNSYVPDLMSSALDLIPQQGEH